ncbi:MAG: hypothetical protein LBE36_06470 [Flavobacteriaceae bacterium]|jgi:ATP/ADP translocase|nr:hypothetical protein [Flavobacteriaceae bacterium]
MSKQQTSSKGIGFLGLLTLVFITLKLIKIIGWSWWWVLSPLWIPVALMLLFMVIFIIVRAIKIKYSK